MLLLMLTCEKLPECQNFTLIDRKPIEIDSICLEHTMSLEVKVLNANGEPQPNKIIAFEVVAGHKLSSSNSATTNGQGIATFTWELGNEIGIQ